MPGRRLRAEADAGRREPPGPGRQARRAPRDGAGSRRRSASPARPRCRRRSPPSPRAAARPPAPAPAARRGGSRCGRCPTAAARVEKLGAPSASISAGGADDVGDRSPSRRARGNGPRRSAEPWTLASASASSAKIASARSRDRPRQRRLRAAARGSRGSMPGRAVRGLAGAGGLDHDAAAGQHAVAVRARARPASPRAGRPRASRRRSPSASSGQASSSGGQEHVAGEAAQRVEVDVGERHDRRAAQAAGRWTGTT